MEGALQSPTTPEKTFRYTFQNLEHIDQRELYIELTESSPGVFVISNENITKYKNYDLTNPSDYEPGIFLGFKPDFTQMPTIEILDGEDEQYTVFGRTKHFKFDDVEINTTNPENMTIKAPSAERAIEILKMSHPSDYDGNDL